MQQVAFYGGAISASLPQRFVDVSPFRDVPDNQEVWVDASTDQSIIIELLHYEPTILDAQCLAYHWNELAQSNDAIGPHATIIATQTLDAAQVPGVASATYCAYLRGQQAVAKYKEAARNLINIDLAIIRIPSHETDILISMNTPAVINQASSSAQVATQTTTSLENASVFQALISSFVINDYSLFNA